MFGYRSPSDEPFGVVRDEYGDVLVEPIECMGGDSGSLVIARDSQVVVLNDRDGYQFDHPVFTLEDLPPTGPFERSLQKFMEENVSGDERPNVAPRWMLHTDLG